MTLSQAQQLGLIPQNATAGGNVKILPKSPTKTIRTTSDGRTVIVQSPSKQQIVIRGGQGGSRSVRITHQVKYLYDCFEIEHVIAQFKRHT